MTPFDPIALVAMLTAFYPVVSAAELARAFRARPEYFAGGRLTGSKGDKLVLPDGRVWDLIYAAGGPASARRWQALDVTNDPPAPDDPFALEDGPLVPLDEDLVIFPPSGETFEALVAGHLAEFGDSDGLLFRAAQDVTEFDGARRLDTDYARLMDPAREAHADFERALDGADLSDALEAAGDAAKVIDATSPEYDDPPPADLPEPDPGDPPADGAPPSPPPA